MEKKKYKYIQIGIASPDEIRSWSYGEVKKHETINYRTLKPERDGLFCEVIFGPTKDYQCACGKSKRAPKGENNRCERCGVELTESKVRRERMGHIELAAPVVHTWFLKNSPSKIALLLDMKTREVEDIVYLASYIVVDPGSIEGLQKGHIMTEQEYSALQREYGASKFRALTGAEAIKKLLQELDLQEIIQELRAELIKTTKARREKIIKRLEVVEAFAKSGNKPEWMVMDVIPVLPPDLRPMVQLDGGRFATTDLNDLYRRILNRNNRLKKQFEQRAPGLITKNEKRMLQEAVDALIDNSKKNKKVVVERNRPLKSLSDLLRGKQGRFRQNLLGKRVDYSGRSVIVVGPDLQMYQCGIPREMALILFKPFIINAIINKDANNPEVINKISIKRAKEMIDAGDPVAMTELEKIVVEHPILLNRAPTLHRLGIQAFEPKLVEGKAIRLHPLVTPAFNADFDGDQMAVHVPLSEEAQAEARLLMLASKNILAPKDGKPIVTPSQDMVLGNYYLTIEDEKDERNGRIFTGPGEVELAYENKEIGFHTRILIPVKSLKNPRLFDQKEYGISDEEYEEWFKKQNRKYLVTTYGKIIFNTIFPQEEPYIPFINEATTENLVQGRLDKYLVSPQDLKPGMTVKKHLKNIPSPHPFKKKFLSQVIAEVFKRFKLAETSKTLDKLKDLGFKYSTVSGITVAISDIEVVSGKDEILGQADQMVDEYDKRYRRGFMTKEERKKMVIDVWTKAKEKLEEKIKNEVANKFMSNHIYMMSDSGARGNISNFVQLSGMRGLMAKPTGEAMDIPIRSSFREGLTMSEFFNSTHGARKGSTDTALKTAESGYLTRRLVDVSQDVTIKENDCGTDKGMLITELIEVDQNDDHISLKDILKERLVGAKATKAISHPGSGKVIVAENAEITVDLISSIVNADIKEIECLKVVSEQLVGAYTTNAVTDEAGKNIVKKNVYISDEIVKKLAAAGIKEIICTERIADIFKKALVGSYASKKVFNPKTKEVIVDRNKLINEEIAEQIVKAKIKEVACTKRITKIETLLERINGRFASKAIIDPQTGEVIVPRDGYIDEETAQAIEAAGIKEVWIRTLLTCDCHNGVCVKCYGSDLATGEIVERGEVVGIIAAQSIGEPGTQLTMRTFHSGGVAGGEDITQGLPRIQELFEAREPKGKALISEIDGAVTSIKEERDNRYEIKITNRHNNEEKTYLTDSGKQLLVKERDLVKAGDRLTEGLVHPKELLKVSTLEEVEEYILKEVQKVYRSQGVEIADKHIEIIIKQMLQKVFVVHEGETDLLPGTLISKNELYDIIQECLKKDRDVPVVKSVLLGITRASLRSDSFLSAASFQETTRVLTEAAIRGKKDTLEGLKENIIIGGLIPAGTGIIDANYKISESKKE
ncbi:MAG TPA: DNA-directed RNA polymerase subunit beta' [Acholeplasmataceae bacterium]|nr:DNA-directed RNA polymerase subunit beta' [Acholeplasmataceae bacterium]